MTQAIEVHYYILDNEIFSLYPNYSLNNKSTNKQPNSFAQIMVINIIVVSDM